MGKKIFLTLIFIFLIVSIFLSQKGFFLKLSSPEKVRWQASWIRKSGPIERKNFYYTARKKFNLSFTPTEANLFISCQSRCEIYLNGRFIQKTGLYSNPPYQYYDYFDISSLLQKGENFISILGYNEGVDAFFGPKKPDGLIAQIEIRSRWQKRFIFSNQEWKMAELNSWDSESERIWKTSTSFQEIFNASKYSDEWQKKEFNDSLWEKAEIIGPFYQKPWSKLILRPIPYLQEEVIPLTLFQVGAFTPDNKADFKNPAKFINSGQKKLSISTEKELQNLSLKNNQFISFKLKKQIAGGVKICFQKGAPGIINIGYSENLNKDGFPDTGRMIFQGDRLINPPSDFCWQPFSPRSFKYLILTFQDFSQDFSLNSVEAIQTLYPVKTVSQPNFNDELLNKIYEIGIDTLKIDMQETYMDCPVRERSQYVGDARVEALVAYQVFGETALTKKALKEFASSQEENGYLSANYPTGHRVNIPNYALQWVNMLWEYYQNSQDKETLKQLYPNLLKLMNYFQKQEDNTGFLVSQKDWWIFIDHGDMVATQNYALVLQSSYYGALKDAIQVAGVLNKKEEQERLTEKANKLKRQINDYFWQSQKGLFDDCRNESSFCSHFSTQGNYWVLYWGIADEEKKEILLKNLLTDKYQLPPSKTPYFNGFIAEVLFKNGKKNEAISLIKNYWGKMIKAGATTWWESFVPEIADTSPHLGESLAHAWGSLPTYLLAKYLKP